MLREFDFIKSTYKSEKGLWQDESFVKLGNNRRLVFSQHQNAVGISLAVDLPNGFQPVLIFETHLFKNGGKSVKIAALDYGINPEWSTTIYMSHQYDSEGLKTGNLSAYSSYERNRAEEQRYFLKNQGLTREYSLPDSIDTEKTVNQFLSLVKWHRKGKLSQTPIANFLYLKQPFKKPNLSLLPQAL